MTDRPDSPPLSPVPPTARDLISREAAIEALETWIANQPDGHYGAWADAIREAQNILETLPASAPPVAPTAEPWCTYCGSEHDVADCDDYNNEPTTDDLAESGAQTENDLPPAPSVGREQIALKVLNDNDWHGAWGTVEETVALLREAGVFDESSVPSCWCGKNRDEFAAPSVGELE